VNGTQDFVPNVFELTGEKERQWPINEHSWLSGILQHSDRATWRAPSRSRKPGEENPKAALSRGGIV
jgi:hypothetical protein